MDLDRGNRAIVLWEVVILFSHAFSQRVAVGRQTALVVHPDVEYTQSRRVRDRMFRKDPIDGAATQGRIVELLSRRRICRNIQSGRHWHCRTVHQVAVESCVSLLVIPEQKRLLRAIGEFHLQCKSLLSTYRDGLRHSVGDVTATVVTGVTPGIAGGQRQIKLLRRRWRWCA